MLMKKWIYYGAGVVTGAILVLVTFFFLSRSAHQGVNYYDEPGEVAKYHSFSVMQVVAENAALVMPRADSSITIYLFVSSEKRLFYDDEIITVPEGKVARIVGTYRYQTMDGVEKTVPIVKLLNE